MKLESLHEHTMLVENVDYSIFKDSLSEVMYTAFEKMMDALTKGLKFVKHEPHPTKPDGQVFFFTNSLLDFEFTCTLVGKEDRYIILMAQAFINEKLQIQGKNSRREDNLLITVHEYLHTADDMADFGKDELVKRFHNTVDEFSEWYFDIAGEYGKVKLFGTNYNIIDGYHRGGEQRFVAYAGDFCSEKDLSKEEIIKRVF